MQVTRCTGADFADKPALATGSVGMSADVVDSSAWDRHAKGASAGFADKLI